MASEARSVRDFIGALDAFARELYCPICLSLMGNPTMTPCRHAFCEKCLRMNIAAQGTCASCRTPITWRECNSDPRITEMISAVRILHPKKLATKRDNSGEASHPNAGLPVGEEEEDNRDDSDEDHFSQLDSMTQMCRNIGYSPSKVFNATATQGSASAVAKQSPTPSMFGDASSVSSAASSAMRSVRQNGSTLGVSPAPISLVGSGRAGTESTPATLLLERSLREEPSLHEDDGGSAGRQPLPHEDDEGPAQHQSLPVPPIPVSDEGASASSVARPNSKETVGTTELKVDTGFFIVGAEVTVARRMHRGSNKPGGAARITRVHENGTYDVKYVVSNSRERGLSPSVLKPGIDVEDDSICGDCQDGPVVGRRRRVRRGKTAEVMPEPMKPVASSASLSRSDAQDRAGDVFSGASVAKGGCTRGSKARAKASKSAAGAAASAKPPFTRARFNEGASSLAQVRAAGLSGEGLQCDAATSSVSPQSSSVVKEESQANSIDAESLLDIASAAHDSGHNASKPQRAHHDDVSCTGMPQALPAITSSKRRRCRGKTCADSASASAENEKENPVPSAKRAKTKRAKVQVAVGVQASGRRLGLRKRRFPGDDYAEDCDESAANITSGSSEIVFLNTKPVVALTNIAASEKRRIIAMVKRLKGEIRDDKCDDLYGVTHIVTKCQSDHFTRRTTKYLQGLVTGAVAVDVAWVEDSSKNKRWLSDAKYLVTGDSTCLDRRNVQGGPVRAWKAMERCRQGDSSSLLLSGYKVMLFGPWQADKESPPKRALVYLLFNTGCDYVESAQHLAGQQSKASKSANQKLLLVTTMTNNTRSLVAKEPPLLKLYEARRLEVVTSRWLLDSISCYKVLPFANYPVMQRRR